MPLVSITAGKTSRYSGRRRRLSHHHSRHRSWLQGSIAPSNRRIEPACLVAGQISTIRKIKPDTMARFHKNWCWNLNTGVGLSLGDIFHQRLQPL